MTLTFWEAMIALAFVVFSSLASVVIIWLAVRK